MVLLLNTITNKLYRQKYPQVYQGSGRYQEIPILNEQGAAKRSILELALRACLNDVDVHLYRPRDFQEVQHTGLPVVSPRPGRPLPLDPPLPRPGAVGGPERPPHPAGSPNLPKDWGPALGETYGMVPRPPELLREAREGRWRPDPARLAGRGANVHEQVMVLRG
ncbi:hypothetical protein PG993_011037 [Apiospora rasikravindrae]|uniref:Uncharacterized protein n=1 Tax=Apiospora rasikravindrae TaxID=990691 RepID=A0ABR1SDE5_9PEZI